jgi:hypothetical protein
MVCHLLTTNCYVLNYLLLAVKLNSAFSKIIVIYYALFAGVGSGHSWSKEQFCAGKDAQSIDIVMTELKPTLSL